MTSDQEIVGLVLSKFEGVEDHHGYWKALCPAHDDQRPSLTIGRGKDQPVVLHCQAGCDLPDVLAAAGLTEADICEPRDEEPDGEWTPFGTATAVYSYVDEDGKLLYEVCRTRDKQFPVRVPDRAAKSGWRWRMGETRRVLYRLDRLRAAIDAGRVIYIVEGEKDVHAVEAGGLVATTSPGGAGKWRDEYSESLRDATVVIVADADKPGRAHAHQVADALAGVAASVQIREAAEGKDVSDHLASGRMMDELLVTVTDAAVPPGLAPDLLAFIDEPDPPVRWVIPNMLERGDRLIWTGGEGLGKSMVTRQFGVAAAAGMHPFHPTRHIPPQRVLYIDCENRVSRSRRKFRELVRVGNTYRKMEPDMFHIVHRPSGINLVDAEDSSYVLERVTAYRPDLLIIGPLYKLHAMDTNEETAAHSIIRVLDLAVGICGSALIVEAHSPHGMPRSLRPRGSSLFLAWPDYGFGIQAQGADTQRVNVKAWRGARDETDWPRELVWGSVSELPWMVPMTPPPNLGKGTAMHWSDEGDDE